MSPIERYHNDLNNGYRKETTQQHAVHHAQQLYESLLPRPPINHSIWRNIFKTRTITPIKGLYFWGGVGRGKTYIMDNFYHSLPFAEKRRVHFHRFIKEVHAQLSQLPKSPDPLEVIALSLAQKIRILCLDEFHVTDVTDAMILAGLLNAIFKNGISLVTTSNIAPDKLYLNGQQRQRFLPAIALLTKHTHIIHLDGDFDYRIQLATDQQNYLLIDERSTHDITKQFNQLMDQPHCQTHEIQLNHRNIHPLKHTPHMAWFEFNELCNTPRASSDYIELSQNFNTILLSHVPQMHDGQNDVAQRFIQLIDALYDNQVKLIISAFAPPRELYIGNRLKFPFERTISRLHEMSRQSWGNR